MTTRHWQKLLERIQADERYQANLGWGKPRPGHPEGTVRAHIAQLEQNLQALRPKLTGEQHDKLRILIHTHDTFKSDARAGVAISHPRSHASLARAFLADFTSDCDLLAMVQWHDEPYALWKQFNRRGACDAQRLKRLIEAIEDWPLFTAFLIVDGCTPGKSRAPLEWFFREIAPRVQSRFTVDDLL